MRTRRFWQATAGAVLGVAATLALGFWQLGRAHEKLALYAAIEAMKSAPALDQRGLAATKNIASVMHRPVVLRGTWVPQATVFLENRQMNAKPGFYVVTPLKLAGADAAIVVQRGWVQRNFQDRTALPPIETPAGAVEVRGRLAPPPGKLYEFAGAAPGPIRQNLDLAAFRAETRLALLEASVQETGPASQGLLRDWPEANSGVDKHYGYMVQWWALSALIAILYVWFQFIAPRRRAAPA